MELESETVLCNQYALGPCLPGNKDACQEKNSIGTECVDAEFHLPLQCARVLLLRRGAHCLAAGLLELFLQPGDAHAPAQNMHHCEALVLHAAMQRSEVNQSISWHLLHPPRADWMSGSYHRNSTQHHIHTFTKRFGDTRKIILPEELYHDWNPKECYTVSTDLHAGMTDLMWQPGKYCT